MSASNWRMCKRWPSMKAGTRSDESRSHSSPADRVCAANSSRPWCSVRMSASMEWTTSGKHLSSGSNVTIWKSFNRKIFGSPNLSCMAIVCDQSVSLFSSQEMQCESRQEHQIRQTGRELWRLRLPERPLHHRRCVIRMFSMFSLLWSLLRRAVSERPKFRLQTWALWTHLVVLILALSTGSCGLEFELLHKDHGPSGPSGDGESSWPFWIFVGVVLIFLMITFCTSNDTREGRAYRSAPSAPEPPGFRSAGYGAGVPPPEYTEFPKRQQSAYTQQPDSGMGGFWTGLGLGGLGGYMFGKRRRCSLQSINRFSIS